MSESGIKMSFRNRWQHLVNDNNNDQGNSSDVFYSELQAQKTLESGENRITITYGAVRQKTFSEADLYTGGDEDGVNTAENISFYNQIDQTYSKLNISTGIRYEQFTINDQTESKPVFRAVQTINWQKKLICAAAMVKGLDFQPLRRSSLALL